MTWFVVASALIGGLLVALGWSMGYRRGHRAGCTQTLTRLLLEARCSCCGDRDWSAQDGAVLAECHAREVNQNP